MEVTIGGGTGAPALLSGVSMLEVKEVDKWK